MANHTYTSDILADALYRAGEATDGSSDYASQALVYLNSVYSQICRGGSELTPTVNEDWAWLLKPSPGVLTLKPALTGTCEVTLNSTTVTLADAQATSMATYYFKIENHADVFRVATHTAGTTAVTLDSVYTGETNTEATYTAFALEYDLASDVMRITAPMTCYVGTHVRVWGRTKIHRADTAQIDVWAAAIGDNGVPDLFAEVGYVTTGVKRVRFNRYLDPDDTTYVRIEYEYLYRPAALTSPGTSEEPALPLEWRHVLSDYLLAYLHGQKNDDRAGAAAQAATAGLVGMMKENRYRMTTASTSNLFRVKARNRSSRRWPLRQDGWGYY